MARFGAWVWSEVSRNRQITTNQHTDIVNPKLLEIQPEATEPRFQICFETAGQSWDESSQNAKFGDYNHGHWYPDCLAQNAELLWELEDEFAKVDGISKLIASGIDGDIGECAMFDQLAELLVAAGFYVYNSDTFFEVYDSLDAEEIEMELSCSEEEAK